MWLKGYLSKWNPFIGEARPPQLISANPGPYDKGVSPDPTEAGAGLLFVNDGGVDDPGGIYNRLAPTIPGHVVNAPPLLSEGSAQRDHPFLLSLAQTSPIGTGVPPERDFLACEGAGAIFDMAAWAQGLGQVANQIGLVYAAANLAGAGTTQGAGVNQLPFALPSEFTVANVSTDGPPLTIPNPSGLPWLDLSAAEDLS